MSKKELALQLALDQITSSFGKGSIMWLGRSNSARNVPVVSTGSFALDIALGTGGLPKVSCNLCVQHLFIRCKSIKRFSIILASYWSLHFSDSLIINYRKRDAGSFF